MRMSDRRERGPVLVLPLLAAALSTGSGVAWAQSTTPTAGLSVQFLTDGNGVLPPNTLQTEAVGIGYDATAGNGLAGAFFAAQTPGTAQSVYNRLRTDRTITAGSLFQVGLRGHAINRLNPGQAVQLFVSIFPLDPTAPAGSVPINPANAVIRHIPILFADSGTAQVANNIYFSDVVSLPQSIIGQADYVIAVSGDDTAGALGDASSAVLYRRVYSQIVDTDPGLVPADLYPDPTESTIFQTIFYAPTNSADTGGPANQLTGVDANPITYQFWALAAAPEPGTLGLLLAGAFGGMAIARRRIRSRG